jgi:hypothetical protein
MPPAKRDPASILDAIIERAPKLHAAGIKSLSFDGLSVELGTPMIHPLVELSRRGKPESKRDNDDEKPPEDHGDPLADPATYPGGRVPGFTRPKKEQP